MKLGEIVLYMGNYNFTKVWSKSDDKQKSFINYPFFCSEFQSVSRIVKIVHSVSVHNSSFFHQSEDEMSAEFLPTLTVKLNTMYWKLKKNVRIWKKCLSKEGGSAFFCPEKIKGLAELVFTLMKTNLASSFSFQNKAKFVLT